MKEKIYGLLICIGLAAIFLIDFLLEFEYSNSMNIKYLLGKELLGIIFNKYMIAGAVAFAVLWFVITIKMMKMTIKTEGRFYIPKWLITVVLAFAIIVICNMIPTKYSIEGNKINRFEKIYLLTKDCISKEIIEIPAENCKIESYSYKTNNRSGGFARINSYYLNIDNTYIIPVPEKCISKLENIIHLESFTSFKVYKNSKMLTLENIEIEIPDKDQYYELTMDENNVINIKQIRDVKEEPNLADRCQLTYVCGETTMGFAFTPQEIAITPKDGKYEVYITLGGYGGEVISNVITYEVKDGQVVR